MLSACGVSVARLSALLVPRGHTIAIAESSAGGLIAASMLSVPGASKFFRGGVVCYSALAKERLLGLASKKLTATEAHALELAHAARATLDAVWGLGETGVAGPDKNSRGCSPGVCAIAIIGPGDFSRTVMLWPEDSLGAADAYGQPPKLSREERMLQFGAAAVKLAAESAEAHYG